MNPAPALSVTLTSYGPAVGADDAPDILDLARMADDAGVDRILLTDHVVMGDRTERYPWGDFPFPPDVPWLEPLSTIAAMAAVTERVRFSTKILIAPLRPAPLLAKTLATLDALSKGRIEVGVSTGWQREEYAAAGVDWALRGRLLTDTMAACRALWTEAPASFASETVNFERIWCSPRPLRRIPIWFAGRLHERNVERICTLGDGWIPEPYAPVDVLASGVPVLRDAWRSAGRDPNDLGIQGDLDVVVGSDGRPDLEASLHAVPEWRKAGATTVNVVMTLFAGPKRASRFFDQLARGWAAI
ncbi:MAG: TIGR03619 family F420-dependent LLM class oxidoreductase [Myxococcales bacterium]|nr:TIGR03619 family F420-dependent LLM class oxidoreductase [Myxococcales bacterium]